MNSNRKVLIDDRRSGTERRVSHESKSTDDRAGNERRHEDAYFSDYVERYQTACVALEASFIAFGRMGGNTTDGKVPGARDGWLTCRQALQKLGRLP